MIAEILSSMNNSPSDEQNRALVALTNDSNNRLVIVLADVVANMDGVASDADKETMSSIMQRANRMPAPALAIAEAVHGFNQVVTPEHKAALDNTILAGNQ